MNQDLTDTRSLAFVLRGDVASAKALRSRSPRGSVQLTFVAGFGRVSVATDFVGASPKQVQLLPSAGTVRRVESPLLRRAG